MKIEQNKFCKFIHCPYEVIYKDCFYIKCLKFPNCVVIKEKWFDIPGWHTKDKSGGFQLFVYKKALGEKKNEKLS